jgi:hypothetical protein
MNLQLALCMPQKTGSRSLPHLLTANSRSHLSALINGKGFYVQIGHLLIFGASLLEASLQISTFPRAGCNFIKLLFVISRTE